jgi:hypothetical protein
LKRIKEAEEVGLTMRERQSVTREVAGRYQKARKKQKGVILNEFVTTTGYGRCYASYVLRSHGKKVWVSKDMVVVGDMTKKATRKRQKTYGEEVGKALIKIWLIMDCICGKRLAPILGEVVPRLEKHREIRLDAKTREKLLNLSPATVDRILAGKRKQISVKGRSLTKPGTLLKGQIPIHTFSDWNEQKPGFVEIDLVGHDGGNGSGEFACTLDVTDVATGWTETQAVKNKAQQWVFEALKDIRERLPFPLLGIDSDNGGEFINHHLYRYCRQEKINFTRSRSYRKNDNCFVEQKNYSVVRRNVGYSRYDTPEEEVVLNEIYKELRLYTNFFQPSMKLIDRTRIGSKVIKKYDKAQTPYRRVLASPDVPEVHKKHLRVLYAKLNPAALKRQITKLQQRLLRLNTSKQRRNAA